MLSFPQEQERDMTTEQLEAIKRLTEATANPKLTAGPWVIGPETDGTEIYAVDSPWKIRRIIAQRMDNSPEGIANSDLICGAPTGVPALLAALREYGGHK